MTVGDLSPLFGFHASVRVQEIDYPLLEFLPGVFASVRARENNNPGLGKLANLNSTYQSEIWYTAKFNAKFVIAV